MIQVRKGTIGDLPQVRDLVMELAIFAVQYTCRSVEDLQEYQRDHSPALQQKVNDRYAGQYASFRTMLEIVGVNVERKD